MQIHFRLSENAVNEMTWEEYEAFEMIQEGNVKLSRLRPILARFIVDDEGNPIPRAEAMKQLGAISIAQIKDVVAEFTSSLTATAVPKENGNSLNSPSEVVPPSEFPAGSEQ